MLENDVGIFRCDVLIFGPWLAILMRVVLKLTRTWFFKVQAKKPGIPAPTEIFSKQSGSGAEAWGGSGANQASLLPPGVFPEPAVLVAGGFLLPGKATGVSELATASELSLSPS